ncbi:MAG: molybdate ABC transporter substrate-binding protein [Verrucomicrobia bacterium Tous-C9LFEB]|nr:MAG: molybdate ABC transporter substrate-binding protein [Verrucomicrobia bacterium Tous-C9LFEB]
MLQVLLRASGVFFIVLASTLFSWAGQKNQGELRVFASVGLTESLTEIANAHEGAMGRKIRLNFAGSDQLARQISMGVPCDLFICADTKWMDDLQKKNLIRPDTRRDWIASNLVIIVNKSSPLVIQKAKDLLEPKTGRIAIGDPMNVSSGIHSREYLEKYQIWKALESRLLITSNARSTLAAVEADRVGIGFVYKTDALIAHDVRIAYEIPASDVPPVHFFAALTANSANSVAAQTFLNTLMQPKSLAVFKRYGFTILSQESDKKL